MRNRPFHLTYPCALVATILIVGGAPPASSGLTGCAAPPPRAPNSELVAAPAAIVSAPAPDSAPAAPVLVGSAPAPSLTRPTEPAPAPAPAPVASEPAVPSAPPHAWKAGEFQRALNQLSQWVKKNGGLLGAELEDVQSGLALGSISASTPQNPASNQKILTTAAVLHHFGADYRFKTTLLGAQSGDRVAELVLRGQGDPSLSSDDLRAMAKTLFELGVRHVGDVLLDQSYFDERFVPPAFEQQPQEWAAFRAPVSAASLNRNVVTLNVVPAELSEPARVWFEPEGFVDISGSVRTEKIERAENVKLTLKESGARLSALVAGSIQPRSAPFRWSRRVADPMLLAGYGLKQALLAAGVEVTGKIALGAAGDRAELATHESQPLAELLPELGKDSDNFYAETLLKDLGAKLKGAPGSSENGAAAVSEYLRELDAFEPGTRILNGSGLFDANRVSARTLVKTLLRAYRDPAMSRVFVAQLAVGGVDGTLKRRFLAFKKQRSIHAKTGTLDDVIALSGYAFRPDGSAPVAFSLIVSEIHGKHGEVRKRIDDIVASVARTLAHDAL